MTPGYWEERGLLLKIDEEGYPQITLITQIFM
jgi:hypothetical protein